MRIFYIPQHLLPFFNGRSAEAKAAKEILGRKGKFKPLQMYELYLDLDFQTDKDKAMEIARARNTICKVYGLCVQEQHIRADGVMLGWYTLPGGKCSNMNQIPGGFSGKAYEFADSGRQSPM